MDSDLFKLLSYLFSLYVTMYTIYLVYKDIRKLWAERFGTDEQAELKEKLDAIFDKYKKESDNDNIFDKLKKEIEDAIKEND